MWDFLMDQTLTDTVQEIVDRARRIETRLTRYLTTIGCETGARKPAWDASGRIEVPSPAASIVDCVAAIPNDWDKEVEVMVVFRGRTLGFILKP